jgi:hypothetical protein
MVAMKQYPAYQGLQASRAVLFPTEDICHTDIFSSHEVSHICGANQPPSCRFAYICTAILTPSHVVAHIFTSNRIQSPDSSNICGANLPPAPEVA